MTTLIPFDNSYVHLPERFFARVAPTPVPRPHLVRLNRPLATHLRLDPDWLETPDGVAMLAGRSLPDGAEPIAAAYAGHQFGHFVPQLGDGRAILLGEVVGRDGQRRDIQLKGSGPTPFSRMGDGRAALGPVLREYIVSEAMAALGIPTTRALAAVTTGEEVIRETRLPGAVLARVAASHVRVGTFQFFAARQDRDALRALADYVMARHYPSAAEADAPYRSLLDQVVAAQADLVARWLLIGFVHGVMNTDNMSIAGETIDYGPCAFLDVYDPAAVFSSIDHQGRYAYGNQPRIVLWNLTRLSECLLPLLAEDEASAIASAEEALSAFAPRFEATYHRDLCRKIGIRTARDGDVALAGELLKTMAENAADFTLTFRRLAEAAGGVEEPVRGCFADPAAFDAWASRWRQRLADEPEADRVADMKAASPAIIPRNHRVEEAIRAAIDDDFGPFHRLTEALAEPFADQAANAHYETPPEPHERVAHTFCGT